MLRTCLLASRRLPSGAGEVLRDAGIATRKDRELATEDTVLALGKVMGGMQGKIDFRDVETNLRPKTWRELFFAAQILGFCQSGWLVRLGIKLIQHSSSLKLDPLIFGIVKHTFYRQFCAGETIGDCKAAVERLAAAGVGSILDYSAEGLATEEHFDASRDIFLETVRASSDMPGVSFACVKATALADAKLLSRISLLLQRAGTDDMEAGAVDTVADDVAVSELLDSELSGEEKAALQRTMDRLHMICDEAAERDLPVLVDAEQTWLQPAIDAIALQLMRRYNQEKAVVYTTCQMYLKGSLASLQRQMQRGFDEDFVPAFKLVRGAYMDTEGELAARMSRESPVHDSIEETHAAYNAGVALLIENNARVGALVASHNPDSLRIATDLMAKHDIQPKSGPHFGQLYGMVDHMSFALGQRAYLVSKYVPFGPVEKVIPYLTRRLEENSSILGGTAEERQLLWEELRRRASRAL